MTQHVRAVSKHLGQTANYEDVTPGTPSRGSGLEYLTRALGTAAANYFDALDSEGRDEDIAEDVMCTIYRMHIKAVESAPDYISRKYDIEGREGDFLAKVVRNWLDGDLDQGQFASPDQTYVTPELNITHMRNYVNYSTSLGQNGASVETHGSQTTK